MNIAVIAADGRLGREVVKEALLKGHTVRAGVRGVLPVSTNPKLEYIHCDATQTNEVKNLIHQQDVVISCIGHVKGSAPDVQTQATGVLIKAMDELGLKRFVDLTGTGVRFPGDKIRLIDFFLNLGVSIIDPSRVKDGITHSQLLQASDLDWTTLRVLKLQNGAPKPFELLLHGPTKLFVGRKEAAEAILEVIEKESFVRQAPIIGYNRG